MEKVMPYLIAMVVLFRSVRDKHVASYADSLESISDSSDMKVFE